MKLSNFLTLLSVFFALNVKAQIGNVETKSDTSKFKFRAVTEIDFASVPANHIQLDQNGTYFDNVKEVGQDVLFQVTRFSFEVHINQRNTFFLLYQRL